MTQEKSSRRQFLRRCALTALGAAVVGCAQPPAPKTVEAPEATQAGAPQATKPLEATAAPATARPVELSMMFWGDVGLYQKLASQFQEEHPNVTIKFLGLGWDDFWEKLTTVFAAGKHPDFITENDAYYVGHAALGALMPLDPFVDASSTFPKDWYKPLWDNYHWDGKQYAVPYDNAVMACWFNRGMLEEAGIDPLPAVGWTYDDWLEMCMRTAVDTNGKHPADSSFDPEHVKVWGLEYFGGLCDWTQCNREMLLSWGTDLISNDGRECLILQPEAMACLEWQYDTIYRWHIAPTPKAASSFWDAGNGFGSGGMIFTREAAEVVGWADPKIKHGTMCYPKGGQKGQHVMGAPCSGYAIPSQAPHPQEAWQWMEFLAGDAGMTVWVEQEGVSPPRKSLLPKWIGKHGDVYGLQVMYDNLDEWGVSAWKHVKRQEIEDTLGAEFELVWMGERSLKEAAQAAKPKVDSLLAQG